MLKARVTCHGLNKERLRVYYHISYGCMLLSLYATVERDLSNMNRQEIESTCDQLVDELRKLMEAMSSVACFRRALLQSVEATSSVPEPPYV